MHNGDDNEGLTEGTEANIQGNSGSICPRYSYSSSSGSAPIPSSRYSVSLLPSLTKPVGEDKSGGSREGTEKGTRRCDVLVRVSVRLSPVPSLRGTHRRTGKPRLHPGSTLRGRRGGGVLATGGRGTYHPEAAVHRCTGLVRTNDLALTYIERRTRGRDRTRRLEDGDGEQEICVGVLPVL